MRVDKAGQDHVTLDIEGICIGISSAHFVGRTNSQDVAFINQNRAVGDDIERAEGVPALRSAGKRQELGGVVDEEHKTIVMEKERTSQPLYPDRSVGAVPVSDGCAIHQSRSAYWGFVAVAFMLQLGMALYDTCTDGLALDTTPEAEQGKIQGFMVGGRSIGTTYVLISSPAVPYPLRRLLGGSFIYDKLASQ